LAEFIERYHCERNHQGLRNQLIERSPANRIDDDHRIRTRERLDGLPKYYYRRAA